MVARINRRSHQFQIGFPGLIVPVAASQVRVEGEIAHCKPLDGWGITKRRRVMVEQMGEQPTAVRVAVEDQHLQMEPPETACWCSIISMADKHGCPRAQLKTSVLHHVWRYLAWKVTIALDPKRTRRARLKSCLC